MTPQSNTQTRCVAKQHTRMYTVCIALPEHSQICKYYLFNDKILIFNGTMIQATVQWQAFYRLVVTAHETTSRLGGLGAAQIQKGCHRSTPYDLDETKNLRCWQLCVLVSWSCSDQVPVCIRLVRQCRTENVKSRMPEHSGWYVRFPMGICSSRLQQVRN